MWPKLSSINGDIFKKITERTNTDASNLNVWVRLFSGVGDGLIMISNPDVKLFAAAGEGGIYGHGGKITEAGYGGVLGRDWDGNLINPDVGRSLRPSPIVTALEFTEGEDQISRSGKISMTAFSLEQLELLQQYFMEPGYNVFCEWGWNTEDGAAGLISTSNKNSIPSLASSGNLVQKAIRAKALNTNGDYDNMLGFIVGGSVGNDGENFSLEIELRGTPELPTYLQSQNVIFQTIEEGTKINTVRSSRDFPKIDLTKEGTEAEAPQLALDRRFATFFNSLPAHRQTADVLSLKPKFTINDYVNCDGLITENINSWLQGSFFQQLFGTGDKIKVQNFQVEKEKLFSKNKYIRFERALDVITASGLTSYTVGDKQLKATIDITNTKIGSFPLIFSTKPESLLIPGKLPDFEQYYLQTTPPSYKDIINNPVENKIGDISFTQFSESTKGHTEEGGYWGYLKNLYINEDMLTNKLTSVNKNIREVLYDILNELSSAVNSFWNFQIVEDEDSNGNLVLSIVDRNWVGQAPTTPKEFYHNGEKSKFLNSALTIDIPGEMANQIISTRLGASVNKDAPTLKVNSKTFFAKGVDKFMKSVTIRGNVSETDEVDLNTIKGQEEQITTNNEEIDDIKAGSTRSFTGTQSSSTTYEYSANGELLKATTTSAFSVRTVYGSSPEAQRLKQLEEQNTELRKKSEETKKNNLSSSVDKLDIVPNPTIITNITKILDDDLITQETEEDEKTFNQNFKIYTFKDTNLFDEIKQNSLLGNNTGRLSQPLPIKYTFTILGNSGLRRGDMFNIVGIPSKYKDKGLFQINAITHSIQGMKWETQVEGLYRQVQ